MRPALVGRLTPDLWGSRRSAGLYPTRTSLLAFTLSPAPEFVIAVRVVHGVPMIWSDRGNRQTNQKMVWLGVITGFQESGSIPIRSFTAPRSRCLQPRYFSVVCTDTCPSRN